MKLGSKGRYAIMAMVDLGFHGRGRTVCLAEIAERQGISLCYLEQLFARLRRHGLVTSVRGPGGGYRLARPVDSISIMDVVNAVDETTQVTRCSNRRSDPGCMRDRSRCLTHDLWAGLGDHIRVFLSGVTLEDVCEGRPCPVGKRAPDLEMNMGST